MPQRELYELAAAFRSAKLWERLYDTELFGVRMPDGEIGYISVMGLLGAFQALAVYPGSQGLDSYRLIGGAPEGLREIERMEHMMGQDCVMCSFEPKSELRPRDMAEIRGYGLVFRGKHPYPLFQRFKPYHVPWYLEDSRDEEWLRLSLMAGLEVARRLYGANVQQTLSGSPAPGASKESLGFTEGVPLDREIPLLSPREDGTFDWGTTALPDPIPTAYASLKLTDDIALMKLKKRHRGGVWECGVFMYHQPVADGEAGEDEVMAEPLVAPLYPMALMVVDHGDGMVVLVEVTDKPEAFETPLLGSFIDGMLKYGVPRELLVRDERTHALVAGVAGQLGIRVTLQGDLPFWDEAERSLAEGSWDNDAEEDLRNMESLFNDVMANIPSEDLPPPLREQLTKVLDAGSLPLKMTERLRSYLGGGETTPYSNVRPKRKKAPVPAQSYVVGVSLGKGCYRHIQIDANETLQDLHSAILAAFDFEDDHAHAFFMDNRLWSRAKSYYVKGIGHADGHATDAKLSKLGLGPGLPFKYVFDFGDEWVFQCKLLKVLEEPTKAPRLLRSVGRAPVQYGNGE